MKHPVALALLVCTLSATAVLAGPLPDRDMAAMRAADIVILGEVHDNADHHRNQASLIEALAPRAVVFEMLSPEQAARVDEDAMKGPAALGDLLEWEASGWPDFALYAPIFEAIGKARIHGAALPREKVRRAFQEGAAPIFGPGAEAYGLAAPLPEPQQEEREEMQFQAHCAAMPRALMGGMVEAQRLRDAHFARIALQALDATGAPVVAITGNGHARRDWGMPAALSLAAPEVTVFSLGQLETPADADQAPYDATIITPPAPRDDPCAAFKTKD